MVQLPQLNDSVLYPVKAFNNYLASVPEGKNLPLFQSVIKNQWLCLTAFKACFFLKLAVTSVDLEPKSYTFHSYTFLSF